MIIDMETCTNGIYLGLGIAAAPLIVGAVITKKIDDDNRNINVFFEVMTGKKYTTAFEDVFFSPKIWTLTYTSCIGLSIAAISLLAMGVLYCRSV